jgi:hypothetical protein
MTEVRGILERLKYKGNFVPVLKKEGLWEQITSVVSADVSDVEKVFLYLNHNTVLTCGGNNKKKYLGLTRGYSKYCADQECNWCKIAKIDANKQGIIKKYGVDNVGKLPAAIEARDKFWKNPEAINHAKVKRVATNLEVYGVENPFQNESIKERSKETLRDRYGVDNPSRSELIKAKKKETTFANYGVEHPLQATQIKERVKKTSLEKYGTIYPIQSDEVKNKMMATKIKNGSFTSGNTSLEATLYFRDHIAKSGYDLDQVAYADPEFGLHEWGYYFDRWYLYDFVAFEKGCRGNPTKVLEIIEYHGPFHYTENDVLVKGNEKAVPWRSNTMTVSESVKKDKAKECFAREALTQNYKVVWADKYHKEIKNV